MVLVDFLMKYPKNRFSLLHFNHGTDCCDEAEEFVRDFAAKKGIELDVGRIGRDRSESESQEEYWRKCRYGFFSKFSDEPILMAHHLNDCAETWIMTSLSGNPQLIPYRNEKYGIVRPMLAVPKSEIEDWAKRHSVEFVTDRSNYDTKIRRNYVRHVMMEHALAVNPGLLGMVRNKVIAAYAAGETAEKAAA